MINSVKVNLRYRGCRISPTHWHRCIWLLHTIPKKDKYISTVSRCRQTIRMWHTKTLTSSWQHS